MTYHSFHSRRVKDYLIEPYQIYYAQGGLYVFAVVPAYGEARQFAIERIKTLRMTDDHFVPDATVNLAREADSLGVSLGGKPELVTIEFQPEAAPYVEEREYHPSQSLEPGADGCVVLKMRVAVDFALSSWVLSFGPRARVLGPRGWHRSSSNRSRTCAPTTRRGSLGCRRRVRQRRRRHCPSAGKPADLRFQRGDRPLEHRAVRRLSGARQFVAHPRQGQRQRLALVEPLGARLWRHRRTPDRRATRSACCDSTDLLSQPRAMKSLSAPNLGPHAPQRADDGFFRRALDALTDAALVQLAMLSGLGV